jgi:uncharacterized membrane protein
MFADFFSKEQKHLLLQSIKEAELATSGEIRLHIENHCKGDVFQRGVALFHTLHMHETAQRNGVLFYLAVKDKRFCIVGDKGIDQKVPPDFWDSIKNEMSQSFKEGKFAEGLCDAIGKAGKQLKVHFPYHSDDKNELADDISFHDN